MSEGWLQVARDALKLPGLLVEIYGDLARPGVRQVGKALETVLGLGNTILWPVALANERLRLALEKNLEKYRSNLEAIHESKVVAVAPEIGVPIAEKLAYVRDDRLSDLYIRLLTKASNADTLDQAHPSFVNVINNLSPDEALLLEYFTTSSELAFVTSKAVMPGTGAFAILREMIVPSKIASKLTFPQNIEAYISNFSGLGLVYVRHNEWIDKSPVYAELEAEFSGSMKKIIEANERFKERKLEFEKGVITITSFGRQFIHACHIK